MREPQGRGLDPRVKGVNIQIKAQRRSYQLGQKPGLVGGRGIGVFSDPSVVLRRVGARLSERVVSDVNSRFLI